LVSRTPSLEKNSTDSIPIAVIAFARPDFLSQQYKQLEQFKEHWKNQ
jgi:hypothetical protein